MASKRTGIRKSTLAALVLLPPIVGVVIYNSFQVSQFQCTVCMTFEGQSECRTVTGHTEAEGLQSATNNACALLTSGMTNSIRCTRTMPTKSECVQLVGGAPRRP
ncbi:MAG TPA: hypothetical protein VL403_04870 [Candidatus Kryptonia bacterium]|nr:hypothetical protein [Candidatus Kryptonia bacterium]